MWTIVCSLGVTYFELIPTLPDNVLYMYKKYKSSVEHAFHKHPNGCNCMAVLQNCVHSVYIQFSCPIHVQVRGLKILTQTWYNKESRISSEVAKERCPRPTRVIKLTLLAFIGHSLRYRANQMHPWSTNTLIQSKTPPKCYYSRQIKIKTLSWSKLITD